MAYDRRYAMPRPDLERHKIESVEEVLRIAKVNMAVAFVADPTEGGRDYALSWRSMGACQWRGSRCMILVQGVGMCTASVSASVPQAKNKTLEFFFLLSLPFHLTRGSLFRSGLTIRAAVDPEYLTSNPPCCSSRWHTLVSDDYQTNHSVDEPLTFRGHFASVETIVAAVVLSCWQAGRPALDV